MTGKKTDSYTQKICAAFLKKFSGAGNSLRLNMTTIFRGFGEADEEEKSLWTAAAEHLEKKGLLHLIREYGEKKGAIKAMLCENMDKLYEATGKKHPGTETGNIKTQIMEALPGLKEKLEKLKSETLKLSAGENVLPEAAAVLAEAENNVAFLSWLSVHFSPGHAKRGMDSGAVEDFLRFSEIFMEPETWESLTTRALSVRLYSDSKRLEYVIDFASPFMAQALKENVSIPDFSLLRRSFPDAFLAGRLLFEFSGSGKDREKKETGAETEPMKNAEGIIINLPLSSIQKISCIRPLSGRENPVVLTVENKETFFVLASRDDPRFDCLLYTGGFPNRAAAALIRLLSASGFSFCHSGDLDIDGILILQNVMDMAGKPVTPWYMDAPTFDHCLPWARHLGKDMFRQAVKISDATRALPGLADLIRRIEETSRGVEQEIIAY